MTAAKQQTQKIGQPGSLINQIMGNNSTVPVVGQGATRLLHTDRECYEVVSVSEDGGTAVLQYLEPIADKTKVNEVGHQNWIFKPTNFHYTVTWRKNAWYWADTEVVFTNKYQAEMKAQGVEFIGHHLYKNDPELFEKIYGDRERPINVVEGITREKKVYSKINIVFGRKDYYYDWSF